MNVTDVSRCETCQTSNGFSSADRRSIIIMVVLVSLALALCFVGVLWYAIRTRYRLPKETHIMVHTNEVFNNQEEEYEDYVRPIENIKRTTTMSSQQVRFAVENELIA